MAELQNFVRDTNSANIFSGAVMIDLSLVPAGATEIDITDALPKGKIILGGGLANQKNDLPTSTATLQLKVGSTGLNTAVASTALKGKASIALLDSAVVQGEADKVTVAIVAGDAALSTGTLTAYVIYV